jgi:hypothetical protein
MSAWCRARKRDSEGLPLVRTLIANIKGNIRGVHHGVRPWHLPRHLDLGTIGFLQTFQTSRSVNFADLFHANFDLRLGPLLHKVH